MNKNRKIKRFKKWLAEESAYRKKIIENSEEKMFSSGKTLKGFAKFVYVSKYDELVIPFRFRKVKSSNRPLVIFHGGAGTLGCDNFKPLFEFFHDANGKAVLKSGCNILIPQQMHHNEDSDQMLGMFSENVSELVKILIKKYDVDPSRIYVYGISYGAMCTLKSLFVDPGLYAAAVEAMGWIFEYEKADYSKIAHIPLWLAHSSDDTGVKIDSDDCCYERLKSLGADIKYTRWDRYGHKMMRRFYRKEPWLEWMLSKRKE